MRRIICAITATALLTSMPGLFGEAFAHGGAYRGPIGEVPGESREPSDPPPPPDDGGPQTPGGEGGGPETPDGGVDGPGSGGGEDGGPDGNGGGGGPAPPTGSPGGPSTGPTGGIGKRSGRKAPGYEDWTFWWSYNKDEILQLKSEIKRRQRGTRSGSSVHRTGNGGSFGGRSIVTATDAAIETKILPALREMLADDDLNFDIQSAAALALAKVGDESIVDTIKAMARNQRPGGGSYHRVVSESAGLSFGLLQAGGADTSEFLVGLVGDKDLDSSFVRPFAAISLGLLGSENDRDGKAVAALLDVLSKKEKKQDVKPAVLLALGLMKNDAVVPDLMTMLTERRVRKGAVEFSENEMPWVVQALGRIGSPGLHAKGQETVVVDAMLKLVDKKKGRASTNMRRSAAIALGQIAPQCDRRTQKKVIGALRKAAAEAKDASVANFAMISLGRIGSTEQVEDQVREDVIDTLGYLMEKAKPSSIKQPFAALALGLTGRRMSNRSLVAEKISGPIRAKFEDERNPRSKGAYAVASGLVRDPIAVESLVETLEDKSAEKKLRGYCAVALGMIQDPAGKSAITQILADNTDRELRVQTAIAAGLIGDAGVIAPLVDILQKGDESQYILGSVALALGQIGDERAIPALIDIAQDTEKKYPDLTRALATVSLGQIGDRRDVPVLSRVARDINYRAHVAALAELLTIL